MIWDNFIWFAAPAVALWLAAAAAVWFPRGRKPAGLIMPAGTAVLAAFILLLWIWLGRPPLRTMGETRLWYSFFLSLVGYVCYRRWRYGWLLTYSAIVATVFVLVNLLCPEIHSKSLMPALQSVWFVPHVTVYILSYAMLRAATICSLVLLSKPSARPGDAKMLSLTDDLVYAGTGLLLLGMLMGCVWAKAAWGHYWSWDPKETWALATAAAHLLYIHLHLRPGNRRPGPPAAHGRLPAADDNLARGKLPPGRPRQHPCLLADR